MRVLMLGWEFPPFISGGLGTACYGLTKAMSQLGLEVLFILPKAVESRFSTHVKLLTPHTGSPLGSQAYMLEEFKNVTFRTIATAIKPYQDPKAYRKAIEEAREKLQWEPAPLPDQVPSEKDQQDQQDQQDQKDQQEPPILEDAASKPTESFIGAGVHYAGDMYEEVQRYARLAAQIAAHEQFDVIHAHDWMTYPAGLAVSALSSKPLVVQVHSTEFDRSGENVNQQIYDIERQGMAGATGIIAVSHLTKKIVVSRYGIPAQKVTVVYNAINADTGTFEPRQARIHKDDKIVLFLGRITMQKGPEYFLAAAKKVLEVIDNVRFVMAGSGDMIRRTIELAAEMGIGHKVLFTGFLHGQDVERIYRMADLYVMPSVSEPFGIAPLEALSHDVPAIVSKQSGVAEILNNVLKVDFWDVTEMANKIIAVLRHPPLHSTLREHGGFEARQLSWLDSARQCMEVYQRMGAAKNPALA